MDQWILEQMSRITEEEMAILDGRTAIDRELSMHGQSNTVNAKKLLSAGKLITLRPHTRFIHFPEHTHDYVEVIYMCSGHTTHIVNGKEIKLEQGNLMFLNQSVTHEILEAEQQDIAVNFIVLPEFFNNVLSLVGEEETPLRRFLVDCLCGQSSGTGFLHFEVAGITPIQNLIENLLIILLQESPHKRKLNQLTMTLLFMQLMGHTETLNTPDAEQAVILKVLAYIKNRYVDGSLTELAEQLHYDLYSLSREIKRKTGKNYTQLVQENRLAQAAFLLKNTDRNVDDIANAVGYENMGYFHRIFKDTYGVSPPSLQTANQVTFLAKTRPPFLILAMVEWLKNKKGGLSLRYFLAIDIGASSGRHIVGWQENGEIKTNEVYRFPNGVQEENGHLTWDVCKLFANVVDSILKAFKQYSQLESLSIDAWGVDYVPPRLGRAQRHNISYLLNTEEVGECLDLNHVIRIIPLGFDATSIIGKIFIVTGTGKYFKNVDGDPQTNLSIVRIAEDGQTAKLLWGYKDGGKFTSDDGPVKA